jgi:hypothetical protein
MIVRSSAGVSEICTQAVVCDFVNSPNKFNLTVSKTLAVSLFKMKKKKTPDTKEFINTDGLSLVLGEFFFFSLSLSLSKFDTSRTHN